MPPSPFAEINILTTVNNTAQTTVSRTKPIAVQKSTGAGILAKTSADKTTAHGIKKAAQKRIPIPTPKTSLESRIVVFVAPVMILLRMVLSAYSRPYNNKQWYNEHIIKRTIHRDDAVKYTGKDGSKEHQPKQGAASPPIHFSG